LPSALSPTGQIAESGRSREGPNFGQSPKRVARFLDRDGSFVVQAPGARHGVSSPMHVALAKLKSESTLVSSSCQ